MKTRTQHRFPPSTAGVTRPGVGRTLTRANIRAFNEARATAGQNPATHIEIVEAFVKKPRTPRHYRRAGNLVYAMTGEG